jgi:hypothetical protein
MKPALDAFLVTAMLAIAALGCGGQTLVKVDVSGDQPFDKVGLRLIVAHPDPAMKPDETDFPGVSFGPGKVYKVGVFLPAGMAGSVTVVGKVIAGSCEMGMGTSPAASIKAGESSPVIQLLIRAHPSCIPINVVDGGTSDGSVAEMGAAEVTAPPDTSPDRPPIGGTGGAGTGGTMGGSGGSGGSGGAGTGGRGGSGGTGGSGAGGRGGSGGTMGGTGGSGGTMGGTGGSGGTMGGTGGTIGGTGGMMGGTGGTGGAGTGGAGGGTGGAGGCSQTNAEACGTRKCGSATNICGQLVLCGVCPKCYVCTTTGVCLSRGIDPTPAAEETLSFRPPPCETY